LRPTEQIVFPKSAALSVSPGHSRGASLPHPLPVCVNGPLWGSTDAPRTVTVTAPGSCPSQRRVTHRPSLVVSALLPTGSDTSCTELPPLLRGSGDSGPAPSAAGDLPLPPSAGGAAEPPPPDAEPPPPDAGPPPPDAGSARRRLGTGTLGRGKGRGSALRRRAGAVARTRGTGRRAATATARDDQK
jgi:hypothetical protein